MAKGSPGIDSLAPVNQARLNAAIDLYQRPPAFWGRYFHAPGNSSYHAAEGALLRDRLIKILPIAQQTTHVGSGTTDGETDGSLNARAIIDTFGSAYLHGAAPDVLVFLDVEKGLPLSRSYYIAWSAALQKTANQLSGGNVSLHPAIYASFSDDTTWAALRSAIAAGAPCAGAWIARWKSTAGGCFPLDEWDEAHVTPTGGLPCPVLLWQYSQECNGFDCDQASPFHEDVLLGRLVLPPALAVA